MTKPSTYNVVNSTVEHSLCIGCGMCAGICPRQNLTIKWTEDGCYQPFDSGNCLAGCGACLCVCPFQDHRENEDILAAESYGNIDGILHTSETGFYLENYVGYAEGDYRQQGTSGGIAKWILTTLLEQGIVDRVICVRPNDDPESLFVYDIFTTSEEIRNAAGSAYYPVELSEAIRTIIQCNGRYAVIGLPCFLKALKLAMRKDSRLRSRIVFTVGLVCGHLKSRGFADLLALSCSPTGIASNIVFREKSHDFPDSRYVVSVTYSDGSCHTAKWQDIVPEVWSCNLFKIRACGYCDDIFAELADIVCMDAWLPAYINEQQGTSIVLVRSLLARSLVQSGIQSRQLSIQPLDVEEVIRSQVGLVKQKRELLRHTLWVSNRSALCTPTKRLTPKRPSWLTLIEISCIERVRSYSLSLTRSNLSIQRLHNLNDKIYRAKRKLTMIRIIRRIQRVIDSTLHRFTT